MSWTARSLRSRLEQLAAAALPPARAFDICAALTLLLLLLYSVPTWYARLAVSILALAGLVSGPLRRDAHLWLVLGAMVLAGTIHSWHQADNHKYLTGYWCLAMFGALRTDRPARALAVNARLLIGLGFAFACLWKAISSDYLDGSFFQYALLIDGRFEGVAERLGGVTPELREINEAAHRALVNYDSRLVTARLVYLPVLPKLAQVVTWWSFLLELAIAVTFLVPESSRLSRPKHTLLLIFIVSTYAVAPVTAFGWLLSIMGVAQCAERRPLLGLAYLAGFFLLHLYRAPWPKVLEAIAG